MIYKNSELYYLNLLIYPHFCFNYKDYTSDALAVIIGASLINTNLPADERNKKLLKFLKGENLEIDNFYEKIFNSSFSDVIASQIDNFVTAMDNLEKLIPRSSLVR